MIKTMSQPGGRNFALHIWQIASKKKLLSFAGLKDLHTAVCPLHFLNFDTESDEEMCNENFVAQFSH